MEVEKNEGLITQVDEIWDSGIVWRRNWKSMLRFCSVFISKNSQQFHKH